jgi:hypothetical protein
METIKGQNGLETFLKKNKKKMDQIHFRPITMEELQEQKVAGMGEIRRFCEDMRMVHDARLEADPLKEIKQDKTALFWCYTYDNDILDEIRMYEMETGIKIVLVVEVLPEEYADIEEREIERKIKAIEDGWQPSEEDTRWLKNVLYYLSIGGIWSAPMGFTFEKTGENELTLRDVKNSESWVAVYQTIKVGEKTNINIRAEL